MAARPSADKRKEKSRDNNDAVGFIVATMVVFIESGGFRLVGEHTA